MENFSSLEDKYNKIKSAYTLLDRYIVSLMAKHDQEHHIKCENKAHSNSLWFIHWHWYVYHILRSTSSEC